MLNRNGIAAKRPLVLFSLSLATASFLMLLPTSGEDNLKAKIDRFAPIELKVNLATLGKPDLSALPKLIEAARVMDRIYLSQVWSGNPALAARLEKDKSPRGREIWQYFQINMGPWSELDGGTPFVPGVPASRPLGANYYPEDMTKEEFNTWVKSLPEAERQKATGFFYTIRWAPGAGKRLMAVPYSQEYRQELSQASQLLRQAAGLTQNPSLRSYLEKRAAAFQSNDYYESDVAWLELDSPIDVTIGPYETYMDELFGYKAAFEAFVGLRDEAEGRKLALLTRHLQQIEDNLPIDPRYRNPKLGALAPIRVIDEIIVGGEAHKGVQTAAFNLPNDERVIREKGSKRVMLRNVQEAKFQKILLPISKIALAPDQRSLVDFEAFFTHILAHELMHGLGPHDIQVNGRKTSVREEMKELYSAIEEAKADISGLFALQYLIDHRLLDLDHLSEPALYATYLAGVFRSVRFGIKEAHGRGMALQFNFLMDEGAIRQDPTDGTYRVDVNKMKAAARKLTGEIMTIQAQGDYAKAKALLDRLGVIRPAMQQTLEKFGNIPVDIRPVFVTANQVEAGR
jgi:hypothetical protein